MNLYKYIKHFFILLFSIIFNFLNAQNTDLTTFFEQSNYLETPRYDETIEYCKKLAESSDFIHYSTFGKSGQNRDLPLLIADKDGLTNPVDIRQKGRLVLLVQACIHAGESNGKDAGFLLLRDNIVKKQNLAFLDNVSIIFIPILNPDGHERFGPYNRLHQNGPKEMGWRTNAKNLNLNRDYLKSESPEIKAWHKLFNTWLPDFFIDIHSTNGADYQYSLTYSLETSGNLEKGLSDMLKTDYEPFITKKMNESGYKIFPYVAFKNWIDPRSGLELRLSPPLYSTGYLAIQNRCALLIESHMLKPYKERVFSTLEILKITLKFLNENKEKIEILNKTADEKTCLLSENKIDLPLNFVIDYSDSTKIDFLGYDYTIMKSKVSGGDWFKYHPEKPKTWNLTFFNKNIVTEKVQLPEAYIIPVEHADIIEKIKILGIATSEIKNDITIPVKTYYFVNPKPAATSFEGNQHLDYTLRDTVIDRLFHKGSVVVRPNQRTARVIAHALEPVSKSSFAASGYFNICTEPKEYAEIYVMEPMAEEMLAKNPEIKHEFETKIKNNPKYKSQWDLMQWFYSKTPYFDKQLNMYPVGLINSKNILNKLIEN